MATLNVTNTQAIGPRRSPFLLIPFALCACLLAILITLSLATAARGNDDIRDLPFVLDAVNDALETARTNTQVPWENPATGNSGVIVVEKTFYPSPETPCRQYRRTFNRPGRGAMMTRGTGCRVGPARWKIEEERTASRVPKAAKSGPSPSPGSTAESTAAPASPVGRTAGVTRSARKKATPPKTAKRPAKTPPKSSMAAKAKPKAPPPPAAPMLPKFTMPSKAEI